MTTAHHQRQWAELVRRVKPTLLAQLPALCPRCRKPMTAAMRLDVGHSVGVQLDPASAYDVSQLRLEHASCNRSAGAIQGNRMRGRAARMKRGADRMPKW